MASATTRFLSSCCVGTGTVRSSSCRSRICSLHTRWAFDRSFSFLEKRTAKGMSSRKAFDYSLFGTELRRGFFFSSSRRCLLRRSGQEESFRSPHSGTRAFSAETSSPSQEEEEEENASTPKHSDGTQEVADKREKDDQSPSIAHTRQVMARRPPPRRSSAISIYDMDAEKVRNIDDWKDLRSVARQINDLPTLTARDFGPFVEPLALQAVRFGRPGAEIAQQIVSACLARLPESIEERYGFATPGGGGGGGDPLCYSTELPYPTSDVYYSALNAWGNLESRYGARQAEHVFRRMRHEHDREFRWLRERGLIPRTQATPPGGRHYAAVIRAWAVARKCPEGPDRAHEWLEEWERVSCGAGDDATTATAATATEGPTAEVGLSGGGGGNEPQYYGGGGVKMPTPFLQTYNAVLTSYAESEYVSPQHALDRMTSILRRMFRVGVSFDFQMDGYTYWALFRVYQRAAHDAAAKEGPASKLDPTLYEEVEDLIKNMLREEDHGKPILMHAMFAYRVAIEVLLQTTDLDDPHHGDENLRQAENIIYSAAGKKASPELTSIYRPVAAMTDEDRIHLTQCIVELVERLDSVQGSEAKERKQRLIDLCLDVRYERVFFLNQAIKAWGKSKLRNGPEVAEAMLYRGLQTATSKTNKPTGESFANVMRAWFFSGRDDAPGRIQRVFQGMWRHCKQGDDWYRPLRHHVQLVIRSWMKLCPGGHPLQGPWGEDFKYPAKHIESFVLWLREERVIPDLEEPFALAIQAWVEQEIPAGDPNVEGFSKVKRVAYLFDHASQVKNGKCSPYTCNKVLEACSAPQPTFKEKQKAYNVAMDTFYKSEHDARTYVRMMQVLREQGDIMDESERQQELIDLFIDCCSNGLVYEATVWSVVDLATTETLETLFGHYASAEKITRLRDEHLKRDGFHVYWDCEPPKNLLVANLPLRWSRRGKQENRINRKRHKATRKRLTDDIAR